MQSKLTSLFPSLRTRAFGISLFSLLFVSGCQSQGGHYEPVSEERESAQASSASKDEKVKAPNFQLTDLAGKTFSLAELKGKVVFLDFWATWCGPCVMSAPAIDKMAEDYRHKGVEIISISLDQNEAPVRQFVERMNISSRVAMAGDSKVDMQYRVSALPGFYLIDQEGFVAGAWQGFHPTMVTLWRQELDRLLAG